jgi:hypothetical protein
VILIAALSVLIAGQITSIEKAWKFFVAIGAGVGLPQMLRWFWWRANAWTEIAGMASAFSVAVGLYMLLPEMRIEHVIAGVVVVSTGVSLIVTLLTAPVEQATLERFARRVRPVGLWSTVQAATGGSSEMASRCLSWGLGVAGTLLALFGLGRLLLGMPALGIAQLCAASVCLWLMLRRMHAERP